MKTTARILSAVVASAAMLSLCLWAAPSARAGVAGDLDSLNNEMSEIQEQISELETQIASLDYQRQSVMEKKAVLDEKNTLAQQELDIIQEQIEIVDTYIANRQSDLEAAKEQEAQQETAWLSRLRAMEETSDISYIQVLFDATSFTDLLTRIDLVNQLTAYDEQLYNSYIASRENVEQLEAEAEEMYTVNEANKAAYEEKKVQLQADIDAACQMIADIEDDMEGYQALLDEQNAAEEELSARIAEKLSQYYATQISASQVSAAASTARSNASYSGDGTTLLWPSWSTWVSSYYGKRTAPVTSDGRSGSTDHKGIDITGSGISGTDVWSAASGTVIDSGTDSSYGNYVVVAMDNGYTARYSHLSENYVSTGQTVAQGESVGAVGSTGISTGAHLDFRITDSDGNYVDPMSFDYTYAD